MTTTVLPLPVKYTVVAKWRYPVDRVAGLGGLTVQAHCLSADTLTIHHLSSSSIISSLRGYPMANFGKWEWSWDKELLLERYSYMHSEKSSLVLTVIRESVDFPCRDVADVQYMQYLRKGRITSPQTR